MGMGVIKNKTDVKIFILFLVNNLRYPLSQSELFELATEEGYIAEFDFTESFSELCDLGHLTAITEEDGETRYLISPKGIAALSELEGTLVAGLRKRSLESAMRILSLRRRGAGVDAKVTRREDGYFCVECHTGDARGMIASFSLALPSQDAAETIRARFLEKPEDVIRGITAVATGEIEYLLSSFPKG